MPVRAAAQVRSARNVNADEAARAGPLWRRRPLTPSGLLGSRMGRSSRDQWGTPPEHEILSSYRNPSGRRARHQLFHSGEIRWAYESVGRMSLMLWGGEETAEIGRLTAIPGLSPSWTSTSSGVGWTVLLV